MPQNGETNGQRNNRLTSWKEIADYLGCDARTCVRWEKHLGLPVHRLEGSKKSRVFAFRDEIDEWQRRKSRLLNQKADDSADSEGQAGGGGDGEAERGPGFGPGAMAGAARRGRNEQRGSKTGRQRKYAALLAAAAVVVVAAAVYFAVLKPSIPGIPADFRIERNDLVIVDIKGKELWRHPTGIQTLTGDEFYRTHYQTRSQGPDGRQLPYLILDDINDDGKIETLFSPMTRDGCHAPGTGKILCFDHRGSILWEFEMGKPLVIGETKFSGDFMIHGFETDDLDGDGKMDVIVVAHQWGWHPTRLCIFSAAGQLKGEFWNFGQLIDIMSLDLDGDGRKEIIIAGTNNEYGKGAVVVFDSADVRGCSPQLEEGNKWVGIGPGSELHYILLPRPDAELAEYYPLDNVSQLIYYDTAGEFSAWSNRCGLEYVFDPRLAVRDVRNTHQFMLLHENAKQAGKISSVLDAAYFENLRRSVLYWDGERWVNTPTRNEKSRPLNPPD